MLPSDSVFWLRVLSLFGWLPPAAHFAFDVGSLFALSVVELNPVFLQFGNRGLCHLDTWSSDVVDVWGPILSSMYQAFGLVQTFSA